MIEGGRPAELQGVVNEFQLLCESSVFSVSLW